MSDEKVTLSSLVGIYDNLDEEGPLANKPETMLGVCITLQILAWACALFRFYVRFRIIRSPWWDDLFVMLSIIMTLFGTVCICLGATQFGLGKHFLKLGGEQQMADYLKGFYIANGSYMFSTAFIKLALLLQFMRMSARGSFLYRLIIGLVVFVALWGISFSVIAWFPCDPISDYWSLSPDANCWAFGSQSPSMFQTTFMTHTSINMILDIIVLAIPVWLFFKVERESKARVGLIILLSLGTIAGFAAIWRLVSIIDHKAATYPTFDPSFYGCISIVLSAVEIDMAVIGASVPVFWPILESNGFQIFVTNEVKVTSEERLPSSDNSTERIELQHAGIVPAGFGKYTKRERGDSLQRSGSERSRTGSEDGLHKVSSGHGSHGGSIGYADDKYESNRGIDALRSKRWMEPGAEVNVSVDRSRHEKF